MEILLNILYLIIGLVILVKGADFLVSGSSRIAKNFGIPAMAIGMTVVAFGTSLPEFVVSMLDSVKSGTEGSQGIALGNVIGSNIANIALILGITALIKNINIENNTVKIDIPKIFVISLIFYIQMLDGLISRIDGLILCCLFVLFMTYIYFKAKNGEEEFEELNKLDKPIKPYLSYILILCGLVGLVAGAELSIRGAKYLALAVGVSELVIGLTIIAVGTSLPELVTTVQAVRRNEHAIGVGNIIGSNGFNILFVIGIVAVVNPLPVAVSNNYFYGPIMLLAVIILWLMVRRKLLLTRNMGIGLLFFYVAYLLVSYFGNGHMYFHSETAECLHRVSIS